MTHRRAVGLAWGLWGLAVVWHPAFSLLAFLLLLLAIAAVGYAPPPGVLAPRGRVRPRVGSA